jgi:hypothetical protein
MNLWRAYTRSSQAIVLVVVTVRGSKVPRSLERPVITTASVLYLEQLLSCPENRIGYGNELSPWVKRATYLVACVNIDVNILASQLVRS